ncbi:restriction endonuclease subunit S [Lactobacillus delbrueckii]|uniref:restriction endonuclease subunit S n=1 Tax=Lactobacillus delbrueckii TaxID=1584 RepID=UPI001F243FA3|nr:restriction endonuclease subunit S [Lactobacillus delbrueckii]GHN37188.1 restriction endonuclease subunit S [Lactobacillus delbrueckii]GHN38896.1 restriction endonuclease subunit S [Lactobacillus delbrueckii]GHN55731.1 restriction endonuclease subunit S [Lactobacillus delbrueckii]
MKDEKKAPKLRFKGFNDDWEQRKLGDVGETYTGLSGKTKEDFGHGEASFVTYMNVYSNPVSDLKMTEPIEIDNHQNEVKYGDVFFTTSSETPEEVGMASVWTGNKNNTYLNSFCFGYRPLQKIDPYYLSYLLHSESVRRKIIILAQGISRYNISKKGVMEISTTFPSLDEQDQIGSLFQHIDHTITLHEEKKRQLERLKSALMQKMFADKSGYPAVRFYGFSDKWEKRKLGDIFEERIEKSHNGSEELLSVTLKDGVVKAESLDRKNNASHDKRNYKLVFPNDIAYNSMRMWQGALGVSKYNGIVSPAYTIIKLKNQLENPCFYQNYFKKYETLNVFRKSSQGLTSDTWNLKYPLFSRIHLFTTSSAEQQNISSLLTLLDYNIALHGYKLELLKKIKKFLLQSMFI